MPEDVSQEVTGLDETPVTPDLPTPPLPFWLYVSRGVEIDYVTLCQLQVTR